ncbi:hypothetical protein ACF0H5_014079 [Mactra antiquata]
MEMKQKLQRSLSAFFVLAILDIKQVWTESVYMDKYGDCLNEGPKSVEDEPYLIYSQGGEPYDTLRCQMTFKSSKDDRLCLSFKELAILRCDLKVYAYSDEFASNNHLMGTYSCQTDDNPIPVCSEGKYLTVLMVKRELSHDDYNFILEIREYSQRDAFAEGIDAFIVSISVIIGIIVGVIVIVVLTAVIIVCCCCKNRKHGGTSFRTKSYASSRATDYTNVQPIQPSAPPLEDPPAYSENPPPYCSTEACVPLQTDNANDIVEQKGCV